MVTTTELALLSLAVVVLTRIYVSFNPPDFLRQYRNPDGSYCGTSSSTSSSSNSPFRRHCQLRPQVVSENLAGKEGQEQDGYEDAEAEGEERGHDEHWVKHEDRLLQKRCRPVPKPEEDGRRTIHVIPRTDGATTNATSFAFKQQDRAGSSDKQAILHHLRNPSTSPSSSISSFHIAIPTTVQQQQPQPHQQWLDLELSSIHYHGSLEPFGTDEEVLKTIQDLQAGSHSSNRHHRNSNSHNGGGRRSPSEFARSSSLTVIWENGRWCCLEGRTLYVLRAVGWNGRIRVRVLVDQGAGATL